MSAATRNRWLAGTAIALAAAIALVVAVVRPTFDMAYFLPEPGTEQERVLIERLGQGAGASLVFIELPAGDPDAAGERASAMRAALEATGLFARIESGERDLAIESLPGLLWRDRYQLADVDWSTAGLRAALEARVGDLVSAGGPALSQLIAHDPVWAAASTLERLDAGGMGSELQWVDEDGRAFLVAETRAPPFDVAAQSAAVAAIERAWGEVGNDADSAPALYGVGVYSALVQALIQRESTLLGIIATVAVLVIVAFAYRSWQLTLMSVIPLAAAVLGGLIAATLSFGQIHGITIAFGATLVGVVDDYPMHLFSHARHQDGTSTVRTLWRTLVASAGTAIIAYATLVFAGSRGLAQLGVFSLAGVASALAVTCWVLPRLLPPGLTAPPPDTTPQPLALSLRAWLPVLLLAGFAIAATGGVRWNDNLSEVTPLPAELLQRDRTMRERLGAPDVRYLLTVTGATRDAALAATEGLERSLATARDRGLVGGWSAATTIEPSAATLARRRQALPDAATLASRLVAASTGLPFRVDAWAPFLADVEAARAADRAATEVDGFARDYVAGHLAETATGWRSSLFLHGLAGPDEFTAWLTANAPDARLVDLKGASESLMRDYRARLLLLLLAGLVGIAALVWWHTRDLARFAWTAGTVAAAVFATLAIMNAWHGSVTLFHLVSLVLVAGLGVDYCLFYSRPGVTRTEFADTRHAVLACAASTAGAFGILGSSSVPLLAAIGATVAAGTALLFVLSRLGCRIPAKKAAAGLRPD